MRVAVWGPLAAHEGAPAEESRLLLTHLARRIDVVAIVRDEAVEATTAPDGVAVVAASGYGPYGIDLDVYHLANPLRPHGYVHAQALRRPGIAVLHEPSLAGLYASICGGERSPLLSEQARVETGAHLDESLVEVAGRRVIDPLRLLCSPRVAAASLCTVVDNDWAASAVASRAPGAVVEVIPRAVAAGSPPAGAIGGEGRGGGSPGEIVVAVHAMPAAWARALVWACAATAGDLAGALVTVAAPPGSLAGRAALAAAREAGAGGRARLVEAPATPGALSEVVGRASLVVAVEWPCYGGTSPVAATSLASGTPVVVGDVPPHIALRGPAVGKVPVTDPAAAGAALARLLARPGLAGRLAVGRAGARRLGAVFDPEAVAERYGALFDRFRHASRYRRAKLAEAPDAAWAPGVNAIASFEATTGLAEAARRAVSALVASGVRVALCDYDYGWAPRRAHRLRPDLRALPQGRPYDVELCCLNVNELHIMAERHLRTPRHPRHVIASWYWELPELPRYLHPQVARVNEIWVPSAHVAGVFSALAAAPVRIVHPVVEPAVDAALTRADFGLPGSKRCYFFHFDANSTLARKNPFGVIEAFRRAFPPKRRDDVQLVMKTINLDRHPEAAYELRAAMADVGGMIVEGDLTFEAMGALTGLCDVYVSLHRAEGFGLGMAEAMHLGKPVVATGYSGNLEFMSSANSGLVGYTMTKVTRGDLRYNPGAEVVYEPGQWWADPDVDEAAEWMRLLHDRPSVGLRLGAAGARTVKERLSERAVGATMRGLLEDVTASRAG